MQYLQHCGGNVIWYQVHSQDRDPVFFVKQYCRQLASQMPGFSSPLLFGMIAKNELSPFFVREYASILLEDLRATSLEDLYLVFDDLHLLEESPMALDFVSRLVSGMGGHLYFVLISRLPVTEELRKPFEENNAFVLGNADLALSKNEVREFVRLITGMGGSPEVINHLHALTDGWTMGVVFECQKRAATEKGAAGFRSRQRRQPDEIFFQEEVFPWIDPDTLIVLMRLSLLDEIPLGLAQTLLGGQNVADSLAILESKNLFIRSCSQPFPGFRIHQLLRECLKRRAVAELPSDEVSWLLNTAAGWYLGEGMPEVALGYYLQVHNYDQVASLLEVTGLALLAENRMVNLRGALEPVPEDVKLDHGWLSFFYGLTCLDSDPSEAYRWFVNADRRFSGEENALGELLVSSQLMHYHLTIDGRFGRLRGYLERTEPLYLKLADRLEANCKVRLLSIMAMGYCYVVSDRKQARRYLRRALEAAVEQDLPGFQVEIHMTGCLLEMMHGDFVSAARVVEEMVGLTTNPKVNAVSGSLAAIICANLLALSGDFFNFRYHSRRIYKLYDASFVKGAIHHPHLLLWQIDQSIAEGKPEAANALVKQGLGLRTSGANPHFRSQYLDYNALLYALKGDREQAIVMADESVTLRREAGAEYFTMKQALLLGATYTHLCMVPEADAFLDKALFLGRSIGASQIRAGAQAYKSLLRIQTKGRKGALAETVAFIEALKAFGYTHFNGWTPEAITRVLSFAYQKGVERAFVANFAAERLGLTFTDEGKPFPLMTIETLGGFRMSVGDKVVVTLDDLSPMQQELVALLISSPGYRASSERIIARFWPEHLPEKGGRTLNVMLLRFRGLLEKKLLDDVGLYFGQKNKQVSLTHCRTDVALFCSWAEKGIAHYEQGELWQAANAFRYAFSFWNGPFLGGLQLSEEAHRFNEYHLRPLHNRSAFCWSETMRIRGRYDDDEMARMEQAIVQGGGDEGLVKNLYTLYINTGVSKKAEAVISLYTDVLRSSGYSEEEIEQELELLWHSEKGSGT